MAVEQRERHNRVVDSRHLPEVVEHTLRINVEDRIGAGVPIVRLAGGKRNAVPLRELHNLASPRRASTFRIRLALLETAVAATVAELLLARTPFGVRMMSAKRA